MAVSQVTFNGNGATSAGTTTLYAKCPYGTVPGSDWYTGFFTDSACQNEVFLIPKLPQKTGYKFLGYYTSASGGTQIFPSSGSVVDASRRTITTAATVYAHWEVATYTLTFNPGDGGTVSPSSKTVTYNSTVGELPTPTLDNYAFAGWYTSATGGTQITASTQWTTAANTTLYAHWTPKPVLTFNANGGTVSPSSKVCTQNQPIGDLPTPEKAGVRFSGWYTEMTGGTVVTDSTTYSWSTDKTIYAHWEEPHTLTLNANGGDVTPSSLSVFTGDAIGPIPTPTLASHFFDGWYTEPDGGDPVDSSTTYSWSTDKTIYAHWTLDEQYLLQFNANGGTVSPASKIVKPGIAVGELPEPTLAGHDFLGWYTEQTGGTQYTAATVYQLHADLVLFAHWSRYIYTIRFNPNGGEVSRTEKDVTRNQQIGELPTPTKYANTFIGWYTEPDGGEQWTASTTYQRTEDTTLYAHWETDPEYSRTLNFNANGGTVSPTSTTCTYGLAIGALPFPVRVGKKFIGWYSTSSASGGTKYTENSMCDWTGAKTIYARWVDSMFGQVEDFFNLASNALIPTASTNGDNKQRICVAHTGKYEPGVGATSGIWRNPLVTYVVAENTTVKVTLGKAFAGGSNLSGYMIVAVTVETRVGQFPTVTVEAVANEGANAINQFAVSIPVVARSKAQNLLNAVRGGGYLNACIVRASCDPVVIAENMMPCASDVVHGRLEVAATTIAANGENAPTAGGNFTSVGEPKQQNEASYTVYTLNAQKEIA